MIYKEIKGIGFMADPKNWDELSWTMHNEPKGLVKYNPNIESNGLGKELMNMFL
jgi:hypothetical protein